MSKRVKRLITLRVDEDVYEKVGRVALDHHTTVAEVFRQALNIGLASETLLTRQGEQNEFPEVVSKRVH